MFREQNAGQYSNTNALKVCKIQIFGKNHNKLNCAHEIKSKVSIFIDFVNGLVTESLLSQN